MTGCAIGHLFQEEKQEYKAGDSKVVDGRTYRLKATTYTMRRYFSHEGPGWDTRRGVLEEYGVREPSELPNEPYCVWEEVG